MGLTIDQASALASGLPWLLPRTLVGLALLTGLRRGELFALRWWDIDELKSQHARAHCGLRRGVRRSEDDDQSTDHPIADAALERLTAWKARAKRTAAQELIFSTVSGKPITPNNVLRRWVWPACQAADLQRVTWLTFTRTYSSWAPKQWLLRLDSNQQPSG